MSIKESLSAVRSDSFILLVLNVVFLFLPGIGVIFLYDQELFLKLDWARLLLLSSAFAAPIAVLNGAVISALLGIEKESRMETGFIEITLGIFLSGLLIYVVMGSAYLAGRNFTEALTILVCVEVICLSILYLMHRKKPFFA